MAISKLGRRFYNHPSYASIICRKLVHKLNIGSYTFRREIGAVTRPHYAYIVWNAALLAKKLGHERISILEFGVAGGNGLVNLEFHAAEVSKILGIGIEIYGFDTGAGLPAPKDYKDLVYHWQEGFFEMDIPALKARLKSAKLIMGNIEDTVGDFVKDYDPAPIGAISFDVDYYSSTVAAFRLFEHDAERFLPRIFCYFDDTIGSDIELYNDYTGMRCAIHEFNAEHPSRKLAQPYNLITKQFAPTWHHQIWIGHLFDHPMYNTFISHDDQQLMLK